jgi:hypothetical protein
MSDGPHQRKQPAAAIDPRPGERQLSTTAVIVMGWTALRTASPTKKMGGDRG